jgi:hypothetical protein
MKSDIPKAITSALIGARISYGAKTLMPIHKGNEERAEKFGNAINDEVSRAVLCRGLRRSLYSVIEKMGIGDRIKLNQIKSKI